MIMMRPQIALERREIGRIAGAAAGPTIIAVAGIHGNEPAGIEAARRVFARLKPEDVRGDFIALAGNFESLKAGVRYQSKDLNRLWTEERVAELAALPEGALDAEDREQRDLLSAIDAALKRARGPAVLADLHTTSAPGIPFILFGDTVAQRKFAGVFPIPIILGLEEQVDGAQSAYWTRHGCITFGCEGGKHDDPVTIDSLEAVLWLALSHAGLLNPERPALPEVARAAALLDRQRGDLPRVLEVLSRRAITPADEFRMEPGFRNIDRARKGQLLARDKRGEIRAERDGLVVMPLYQGLGGDGFFWGREVSPARLKTADALRKLGVDKLLGILPGVKRDPSRTSRLLVNKRVARFYPLEVFQLLGYRRLRERGELLMVERQ